MPTTNITEQSFTSTKELGIVKVGDPNTAYVPSPDEGERLKRDIEGAFKSAGRDVEILLVPYSGHDDFQVPLSNPDLRAKT